MVSTGLVGSVVVGKSKIVEGDFRAASTAPPDSSKMK
jgi:hypothetical protein